MVSTLPPPSVMIVSAQRAANFLPRGEPPQDDGSQAAVLPDNAMP